MSRTRSRLLLVAGLILGTSVLHHMTPGRLMYVHILLQALFFVPVSLAGLWFGKKGALIAAAAISSIYLHHAITVMMPTGVMAISNSIQMVLLFLVGLLVGAYTDIRRGYEGALQGARSRPMAPFSAEQKLLVYVDESRASMNAVRYVAAFSKQIPELTVTLLGITQRPNPELFDSDEELSREKVRAVEAYRSAIDTARMWLLQSGLAEDRIEIKNATSENTRASDLVLNEQKTQSYSAIVVGKNRLSRAEEFLFGNIAIRIARKAVCPVWVIGDMPLTGGGEKMVNSESCEDAVKAEAADRQAEILSG